MDGTHWSGCTSQAASDAIDLTADVVIDTDNKDSAPAGYACVVVPISIKSDHTDICALFASSIKIEAGVTLSAHGQRPLALFAHSIDIEGTVDVASHIGGQRGPASNVTGCNPSAPATRGGGGAGGTWTITGGHGGDQGQTPGTTGGAVGHAFSATELRGGCDGRRGGDGSMDGGPDGSGGAGGGAVWIASDMSMLTLGSGAVINASGAGGPGAPLTSLGGGGGGSGGLIVLQSTVLARDLNAQIFANGGHGGGGTGNLIAGGDGGDPTSPGSTGVGGTGGDAGNGGNGYPASGTISGNDGNSVTFAGGGGGGGGGGVIRFATNTPFSDPNNTVSPNPVVSAP
jgi:hypothetical protein